MPVRKGRSGDIRRSGIQDIPKRTTPDVESGAFYPDASGNPIFKSPEAGEVPLGKGNRVSLQLNVPGVLDTASSTAMSSIAKFTVLWNLPPAILIEAKGKVETAVSTGTEPSFNVVLNGTNALSSSLSVNETFATGTIDTNNDDIANGQIIEVNLAIGNADGEDLVMPLEFEYI